MPKCKTLLGLLKQARESRNERLNITADQIVQAYDCDNSSPPRKKQYFGETRRDKITINFTSGRREEHVAKAVYVLGAKDLKHKLDLPDGSQLELLDYQFPLRSSRADKYVGKVDLIGCIDKNRLAAIELKVKNGEGPLVALLEALLYGAIIEGNFEPINAEIRAKWSDLKLRKSIHHMILAEQSYWDTVKEKKEAEWKQFCDICRELRNGRLKLTIDCYVFKSEMNLLAEERDVEGVSAQTRTGTPRKGLNAEQIIKVLRQVEALLGHGKSIAAACKEAGITQCSYSQYRKAYGGLSGEQAKRLNDKQLLHGVNSEGEWERSPVDQQWWASQSLPFPAPPIKAAGLLIPISSAEDLVREHQDFGITLDNFWMRSVLSPSWGTAFFFKWCGPTPAILLTVFGERELTRVECRGKGDQPVPNRSEIVRHVLQAFATDGFEVEKARRYEN